jgi:hypothetical protein
MSEEVYRVPSDFQRYNKLETPPSGLYSSMEVNNNSNSKTKAHSNKLISIQVGEGSSRHNLGR